MLLPLLLSVVTSPALPATQSAALENAPLEPSYSQESIESAFNYNYANGGIVFGGMGGLRTSASYEYDGPWLAVGNFAYATEDGAYGFDTTLTSFSAGAGYVHTIQPDLDVVSTLELEYGSYEFKSNYWGSALSTSEIGIRGRSGVRYSINDQLEAYGGATFRTIFSTGFVLDSGALYHINDAFAAFADLEIGNGAVFSLGVRYHW